MKRTFQDRELFCLFVCGQRLQGTYHFPNRIRQGLTGILFLTGISTPRAAHGNSGVDWAESFADSGYPSFRVDLPGSGDSEEGAYAESLSFVNAGGHGSIASEMVRHIVRKYNLAGMVIVGHCAGATSALFGAADTPECKGLVLLAPYFHLPQPLGLKARRSLIDWAARNRFGHLLSHLYLRAANLRPVFGRKKLPGNTNLPLLARCQQLVASSLPILMLKGSGPNANDGKVKGGEFDYFRYLVRSVTDPGRLQVRTIEGSHHTFANQAGRTGVQIHVERWLSVYFPLKDAEPKLARAALPGKTKEQIA